MYKDYKLLQSVMRVNLVEAVVSFVGNVYGKKYVIMLTAPVQMDVIQDIKEPTVNKVNHINILQINIICNSGKHTYVIFEQFSFVCFVRFFTFHDIDFTLTAHKFFRCFTKFYNMNAKQTNCLKMYVNSGCEWGSHGYNCNETCQTVCAYNGTCSAITGTCEQVNHRYTVHLYKFCQLYVLNGKLPINVCVK